MDEFEQGYKLGRESEREIIELIEKIDGPLFRKQRKVLLKLINEAYDPIASRCYTWSESEALEGLQNLLDGIADCAHDIYGKDCLFTEQED